jgi:hypothetical protein
MGDRKNGAGLFDDCLDLPGVSIARNSDAGVVELKSVSSETELIESV